MRKSASVVYFLLNLSAILLVIAGIVAAITAYSLEVDMVKSAPSIFPKNSTPVLDPLGVLLGFWVASICVAGLAQITKSTAITAAQAEAQTDILRQLADSTAGSVSGIVSVRTPSVDETARMVASQVRVERRPK